MDFIFGMNIHWGKTFQVFGKPASQVIKYAHIDPITDFCILVLPEAIVQARALTLGSVCRLFNAFSSYVHLEGTVYAINKKNI